MHPHLHTKDNRACEEVMTILDECHARGFLWKSMGMCNSAKTAVNKCLRAQRLERTAANRAAAKAKNEEIRQKWAEIDANS
ncbi:cytochrome c oxidase biogenesis protein Cmc1-like protein [Halenospora varia]|nr:cytochrome c oxidase biogenesis protein Cmc1-like protein [Halenospora varia]